METQKILVSGNHGFIYRHQHLFKAMSFYCKEIDYLKTGDLHSIKLIDILVRFYYNIIEKISPNTASFFWKNSNIFIARSKNTEIKIRQIKPKPDIVFHLFCMFNPFWINFDTPYVIYTDYTMALAKKNWQPWAPFRNDKEYFSWIECEVLAYKRSAHIFTLSNIVKQSLIEDYGMKAEKITVVGSSGHFQKPYEGEKTFGTKQILFNGSDFDRKGGNIVLEAFRLVKQEVPEAKLVIVGKKLNISELGIENPGHISSSSEIRNLFLQTDLVVAPAYCEPYGIFLVEAMNYGVPCIASANGGMSDIVDNGINGILMDKTTPQLLACEIKNLICNTHLLQLMSQNAREKVKTKLNPDSIAQTIYQTLLRIN